MQILVGYRGTNVGQDLLKLAIQHAKAFGAEIQLVTSLQGGERTTKKMISEAEENLAQAGKLLVPYSRKSVTRNKKTGGYYKIRMLK